MNTWTKTEDRMPRDGARVEWRIIGIGKKEPKIATYYNKWNGVAANGKVGYFVLDNGEDFGPYYGEWRYPEPETQEKLATGHPGALKRALDEAQEENSDLLEALAELQGHCSVKDGIITNQRNKLNRRGSTIQALQRRVNDLKSRLADSDKLSHQGWISADEEMPESYGEVVEVMQNGKVLWESWVNGNDASRHNWWTCPASNIDARGTYWRPLWQESSPENLAKIGEESVEVMDEKGKLHLARTFLDDEDNEYVWHIIGNKCWIYNSSGAKDEGCVNISVRGTKFRRLPRRGTKQ